MHEWGDEWFQEHGQNLYDAIDFIEKRLRKAGICVYGKEKWGCWVDEYLKLWDGSLSPIFFGWHLFYNTWYLRLFRKIDYFLIPYKKTKFGWLKFGVAEINKWLGLVDLVCKWQANQYNKAIQLACKKWPDVTEELIVDTEGYQMVKPCKWGDVDGELIHRKYWK